MGLPAQPAAHLGWDARAGRRAQEVAMSTSGDTLRSLAQTGEAEDLEAYIRGVSDRLLQAVHEVGIRETQKRGVAPAAPEFPALAEAVRISAEELLRMAREEERTARMLNEQTESADLPPIEELAPEPSLGLILEEWRAIERRLAATDPGTPEAEELLAAFEDARSRYADALARVADPAAHARPPRNGIPDGERSGQAGQMFGG